MSRTAFAAAGLAVVLSSPLLAMAQAGPVSQSSAVATPGFDGREQRFKALHDILGITPAEEPAFQALAAASEPDPSLWNARLRDLRAEHAQMATLTTPQRLDAMAKMMDAREAMRRARFTSIAEATKNLYAELTPEQRRIMDALPELRHGGWDGPEPHGDIRNGSRTHGGDWGGEHPAPPLGAGDGAPAQNSGP